MAYKSEFLQVLSERGFIHQGTDLEGLDALAAKQPITGYVGFDPTADSLHVGNMVSLMLLHWLQATGHKPIALVGGATGKVGDPSFRDTSRPFMDDATLQHNLTGIQKALGRVLRYDGDTKTAAITVDNNDWLSDINYLSFLRDIGPHFTINRMLSFDSVKLRLEREQPLTYLEFNYMIMQAYDFVELYKTHGCVLQMGGSDQWGNIVNGIELGRRTANTTLYGLTTPLLTTASGAKMGKSVGGAIWLNSDKLPVYDFYQYWRNTEDADVGRFLKIFTTLPMAEITRLAALEGSEINEAKKVLALEVTAFIHGRADAEIAAETARKTFEDGGMAEGLPTITITGANLAAGYGIVALVKDNGLAASNGEARRLIQGGGVRLNDAAINSEDYSLQQSDFAVNATAKLSVGKKRHVLIQLDTN